MTASGGRTRIAVGIDCADPGALIGFWTTALDYEPDPAEPRGIVDPGGRGPAVWFQQVPEAKVVKNRLHLDVWFDGEPAAEARRDELVALGGTAVERFYDFWLMSDPVGNEFCLCWPVSAPPAGDG